MDVYIDYLNDYLNNGPLLGSLLQINSELLKLSSGDEMKVWRRKWLKNKITFVENPLSQTVHLNGRSLV